MTTTEQGTHFWLLVAQVVQPNGTTGTGTYHGTLRVGVQQTRQDVYEQIKAQVTSQLGGRVNVTNFVLEPNQL